MARTRRWMAVSTALLGLFCSCPQVAFAAPSISNLSATPSTISFAANMPGSAVSGSAAATVSWKISNGSTSRNWTLKVAANSTNFTAGTGTDCTLVPASAITVTCFSISGGSGSCQSGFSLSTTGTTVASGTEASGTSNLSVTVNYTFSDSWKYVPNTCPLTITYTVTV